MPSNPKETYAKLLAKELNEGDKWVLIDVKWLEYWKRFVGLTAADSSLSSPSADNTPKLDPPGPMNHTLLHDPAAVTTAGDPQLNRNLVEGNDYSFVPLELYEELDKTYGHAGQPIIRPVIPTGEFSVVIEAILTPLRFCRSRGTSSSQIHQVYKSRRTTIDQLKKEMADVLHLSTKAPQCLAVAEGNDRDAEWEVINEADLPHKVLADLELSENALLSLEPVGLAQASTRSSSAIVPTSPRVGATGDLGFDTAMNRGVCGLSNLGNTCFMNSALQCISNVPELTRYFLSDEYKQHINQENPLGMKGDVAKSYGELMNSMWRGGSGSTAPKTLKHHVARYAPQFSGYSQQDSQEFICFLLDGLHEDLNLVRQKPYVEKTDDDGSKDDRALANEQWEYYKKRNQSKINDLFHGQIKSAVQCTQCQTLGRTFDPICFLSLPLPNRAKAKRTFKIDYVRLNGSIKTYSVKSVERGRMKDLIKDFCARFVPKPAPVAAGSTNGASASSATDDDNKMEQDDALKANEEEAEEDFTQAPDWDHHQPKPELILAAEVYNHRIHLQYSEDANLANVLDRDQIVFYEVPVSLKKENNDTILMPCLFRVADSMRTNFGLPIYLNIPRNKCTGQHIQNALQSAIPKFLPLAAVAQTDSSSKPLYAASCMFSQNYQQTLKTLAECLDTVIDFSRTNTTLMCDVARSVVDKYEEEENKRTDKDKENRLSGVSSSMGMTTRSQINKQPTVTLIDCFKHFTNKESLSEDDQWYCPKCKSLRMATKKIDLWRMPKVLIVQLKRFNYTRHWRDKIDLFIDCPTRDLDLSSFVLNKEEKHRVKYDLIAVSNHMGGLGGGHYTAHAKNHITGKWYTFDDSSVSETDEASVISKSAYVLIYQLQDSPSASTSVPTGASSRVKAPGSATASSSSRGAAVKKMDES